MSRLAVQRILGAIWLLDGLLQLKPKMFSKNFVTQVILPTADSQPKWIANSIHSAAQLVLPHIGLWNAAFAAVQIVLGVGLLLNRQVRWFLAASFVWALFVWWFGEGFGQLLTGQTLLLSGAPGAVLLYALLGIAVWPRQGARKPLVNSWRPGGVQFSRYSIGFLWIMGSGLHLQHAFLEPGGLANAITVSWISQFIGNRGVVVSIGLAIMELALGLLFIFKVQLRFTTFASIVMSTLYWWIGQSFGQVFDPLATDVNSGLLLIILSIAANPRFLSQASRRVWRLHSDFSQSH